MNEQTILEASLDYVNMGLTIIPLCSHDHSGMSVRHKERCSSPGKAPILAKWSSKGYTTEEDVNTWFKHNPHRGIGLVLGQTDFWNIVGVDIDGQKGAELWDKLSRKYGAPATWEFITGGGGRRLLYALPVGLATRKHRVAWEEGHQELAFLAQGQQTVLPPSMHASGKKYEWVQGRSPYDQDIAEAPKWIIDKIRIDIDEVEDLPDFHGKQSKPVTSLEFNQNIDEGTRSNSMARFVGSLCAKRELPKETIMATAMQHNKLYCKPPLPEEDIRAMVESIWRSEQEKHQKALERQRKRLDYNPSKLAQDFYKSQLEKGMEWRYFSERQRFYRTDITRGPWREMTPDYVDLYLQEFLISVDPGIAVNRVRNEVKKAFSLLLLERYGEDNNFDIGRNPDLVHIAVPNGVLRWREGKLVPWSPKFKHTTTIAAEWSEELVDDAAMSTWLEALRSWIPEEKTIQFLQEYIGYALLPSCKLRTAVFLSGKGANGKSLFMDVVRLLFEDSYVVAQPSSIAHRFGTTSLIDKQLIICSDIDASYLDRTGVLKQIISGDEIRAEYKGGADFSFVPIGKMLFSANELPRSSDRSYGWYSRLQFIHFPNQFEPNDEYYQHLLDTMGSPGGRAALLKWAVEGLQRLHKNGRFTISNDMLRAKGEYIRSNDNVAAFVDDLLVENHLASGGYKTSLMLRHVYQVYREWSEEAGVKPVRQAEFSSRLAARGIEVRSLRWKIGSTWRSAQSLVDMMFVEDDEMGAKKIYESYARAEGVAI